MVGTDGSATNTKLGCIFSMSGHLEEACKVSHPTESTQGVPQELKHAAMDLLSCGHVEATKRRLDVLKACVAKAHAA